MNNKKNVENDNTKLKNEDNKKIWIWGIIGGILFILLLLIIYWIYSICYDEHGEYGPIGKSCFERIKEELSGKFRIDIK